MEASEKQYANQWKRNQWKTMEISGKQWKTNRKHHMKTANT